MSGVMSGVRTTTTGSTTTGTTVNTNENVSTDTVGRRINTNEHGTARGSVTETSTVTESSTGTVSGISSYLKQILSEKITIIKSNVHKGYVIRGLSKSFIENRIYDINTISKGINKIGSKINADTNILTKAGHNMFITTSEFINQFAGRIEVIKDNVFNGKVVSGIAKMITFPYQTTIDGVRHTINFFGRTLGSDMNFDINNNITEAKNTVIENIKGKVDSTVSKVTETSTVTESSTGTVSGISSYLKQILSEKITIIKSNVHKGYVIRGLSKSFIENRIYDINTISKGINKIGSKINADTNILTKAGHNMFITTSEFINQFAGRIEVIKDNVFNGKVVSGIAKMITFPYQTTIDGVRHTINFFGRTLGSDMNFDINNNITEAKNTIIENIKGKVDSIISEVTDAGTVAEADVSRETVDSSLGESIVESGAAVVEEVMSEKITPPTPTLDSSKNVDVNLQENVVESGMKDYFTPDLSDDTVKQTEQKVSQEYKMDDLYDTPTLEPQKKVDVSDNVANNQIEDVNIGDDSAKIVPPSPTLEINSKNMTLEEAKNLIPDLELTESEYENVMSELTERGLSFDDYVDRPDIVGVDITGVNTSEELLYEIEKQYNKLIPSFKEEIRKWIEIRNTDYGAAHSGAINYEGVKSPSSHDIMNKLIEEYGFGDGNSGASVIGKKSTGVPKYDYRITINNNPTISFDEGVAFSLKLNELLAQNDISVRAKILWDADAIVLYPSKEQLLPVVKVLEVMKNEQIVGKDVATATKHFARDLKTLAATIGKNPYYGISCSEGPAKFGTKIKLKTNGLGSIAAMELGHSNTFGNYVNDQILNPTYSELYQKYNGDTSLITPDEMYDLAIKRHNLYSTGSAEVTLPIWERPYNKMHYHKDNVIDLNSKEAKASLTENSIDVQVDEAITSPSPTLDSSKNIDVNPQENVVKSGMEDYFAPDLSDNTVKQTEQKVGQDYKMEDLYDTPTLEPQKEVVQPKADTNTDVVEETFTSAKEFDETLSETNTDTTASENLISADSVASLNGPSVNEMVYDMLQPSKLSGYDEWGILIELSEKIDNKTMLYKNFESKYMEFDHMVKDINNALNEVMETGTSDTTIRNDMLSKMNTTFEVIDQKLYEMENMSFEGVTDESLLELLHDAKTDLMKRYDKFGTALKEIETEVYNGKHFDESKLSKEAKASLTENSIDVQVDEAITSPSPTLDSSKNIDVNPQENVVKSGMEDYFAPDLSDNTVKQTEQKVGQDYKMEDLYDTPTLEPQKKVDASDNVSNNQVEDVNISDDSAKIVPPAPNLNKTGESTIMEMVQENLDAKVLTNGNEWSVIEELGEHISKNSNLYRKIENEYLEFDSLVKDANRRFTDIFESLDSDNVVRENITSQAEKTLNDVQEKIDKIYNWNFDDSFDYETREMLETAKTDMLNRYGTLEDLIQKISAKTEMGVNIESPAIKSDSDLAKVLLNPDPVVSKFGDWSKNINKSGEDINLDTDSAKIVPPSPTIEFNTEAISLSQFTQIKEQLAQIVDDLFNGNVSDEDAATLKFLELQKTLESYDLSGIPFEAWEGLSIHAEELDLSKTRANIDFKIFDFEGSVNFKGCNLRNLSELRNKILTSRYVTINLDGLPEEFIQANRDILLLDSNISEEVRERYYQKDLTLDDIIENIDVFSKVPIENFCCNLDVQTLVKTIGGDNFSKILKQHSDVVRHILEDFDYTEYRSGVDVFAKYFSGTTGDVEARFDKAVRRYFLGNHENLSNLIVNDNGHISYNIPSWIESMNYRFVQSIKSVEELMNYDSNTFVLNKRQMTVIDKLGINNIKRFESETDFFLHTFDDGTNMFGLVANYLDSNSSIILDGNMTYAEFTDKIADCLDDMRRKGFFRFEKNYDWIEGVFREEHPDIFMDSNVPESLKESFYSNTISIFDLQFQKEYIPYLLSKRNAINTTKDNVNLTIHDTKTNEIITVDFFEEYTKRFGFSNFMDLYNKFTSSYHDLTISGEIDLSSKEAVDNAFMDLVYKRIVDTNCDYLHLKNVPEFVSRHPDIFMDLSNLSSIPKDEQIRLTKAFYAKNLLFEDIIKYPEFANYLKDKNFDYGFSRRTAQIDGEFIPICKFLSSRMDSSSVIDLLVEYGKVLDDLSARHISFSQTDDIVQIKNKLNITYSNAIRDGLVYSENVPQGIKEMYPQYFLDESVSSDIKDKFYNKRLTLDDFYANPELLDIIGNTNVACGFPSDMAWIMDLFTNLGDAKIANENRLRMISEYLKIDDKNYKAQMQSCFKDYIESVKNNIIWDEVKFANDVISKVCLSNSSEVYSLRNLIISEVLKSKSPLETFDKIENLFIKNNIPMVGKIYSCFEMLHPDFRGFDFSEGSTISPILKGTSTLGKKMIVFSDLIKSSFGSNNRSVIEYLKNIEVGNALYEDIKSGKISIDSLSEVDLKELTIFSKHVETLYHNTMNAKNNGEYYKSTGNVVVDILELAERLSPNGTLDYNLGDRIVRMFCGFAGFDTVEQAQTYISDKIMMADVRNRNAANSEFNLVEGDFIKGIGEIKYLRSILQNGSVSKEYLGASAGSDATPLDTDVSMIEIDGSLDEQLKSTAAGSYGPIWFVLKNDNRFTITRNNQETLDIKRDLSKLEAFYTGVLGSGHYGIRTGFASSEINYIVTENNDPRIGLEIAMNGFYIPVVDLDGKIIFTPEDYDNLRRQMSGLSYYDESNFAFSRNLVTDETIHIASHVDENMRDTSLKETKIREIIKKSLDELGLSMKTSIDGDLTEGSVELIDTGSTGRGTNKLGDGDFDFMMRLDNKLFGDKEKLRRILIKNLGEIESSVLTDAGDLRLKGVKIDNETIVDIDISFAKKTDKLLYSTDEAVRDRLETIKKNNPDKYKLVVGNILLAKNVLKEAGAYKPNRGEVPQGGLGGVGVENWILQNGGSFVDAATSFLNASEGKTFNEFCSSYRIWDFGDNHLADKKGIYPHDNFVSGNMSEEGYTKMRQALKEYLEKLEKTQMN